MPIDEKALKQGVFEHLTVTSVEKITDDADWDIDEHALYSGDVMHMPAGLAEEGGRVEAGTDLAEEKPEPVELTDEQKIEALDAVLNKRKNHREIFYKILEVCRTRTLLPDLEAKIAAFPEFKTAVYDQYLFITLLENNYGLVRFELDETGNVVVPEQKEGLTEDEIDDLVWGYAFETTEFGEKMLEKYAPRKRMFDLFSINPARTSTYRDVLAFCNEQTRTYKDIEALLNGRDIMWLGREGEAQPLMASVFVEKLEAAGGLVYENGWKITAKGKEVLELLLQQ